MSVRASAETLRSLPLFAACDDAHLHVLAFAGERVDFAIGEHIVIEGKRADSAYLILDGEANIISRNQYGEAEVETAVPGTFIGETAMVGGIPYRVSVIAATPVTATRIRRSVVMRVAREYPQFGAAVFDSLSRRLAETLSDLQRVRGLLDGAGSFSDLR